MEGNAVSMKIEKDHVTVSTALEGTSVPWDPQV